MRGGSGFGMLEGKGAREDAGKGLGFPRFSGGK